MVRLAPLGFHEIPPQLNLGVGQLTPVLTATVCLMLDATYRVQRLRAGDRDIARRVFALMADVFAEPHEALGDAYVDALLGRADFWVLAARANDEVIAGLTAHTLPMTRAERAEVFLYDVAVRADHQRRGVGRQLLTALRDAATAAGGLDVFVAAEAEDSHALDFYRALGGTPTPMVMFTFAAGRR
jgi:aminoglycoside 3-N-acetyltransferase I